MTDNNLFAGHSKDDLTQVIHNMRYDSEDYGDISRLRFEEFFDGLLEQLAGAGTDEQAQQIVTGAFPPDTIVSALYDTLGNLFAAHGTELRDYNTVLVTHGIVRDRLK